jgi:thiamine transport system ATP-binding protein
MLRIEGLRFSWGEDFHFTYDLSVASGEILAVQGPSGVGKTTLLELIAGFQTPTAGNLKWDDKDLVPLPPWQRPVTTVFQADNLFSHLSCLDNVLIGLGPEERPTPALHTYIDEYFTQLGLEGLQSRMPSQISGGQQQRVALVRALIRARPILLLDESFSALDWDMRKECFDALKTVVASHEMAALLVSHDTRDAEYLGCRELRLAAD